MASDDWSVGDLAVCVEAEFYNRDGSPASGPELGGVYTVTDIGTAIEGFTWIGIDGFGDLGMDARQFRKIRPDQHEACESEFVTLLKRSRNRVVA